MYVALLLQIVLVFFNCNKTADYILKEANDKLMLANIL